MEDNGGHPLVSPVDPEIKTTMKQVLNYFERAHNIKATKLNVKKFRKSLALWLANMTYKDEKDFSYELTNRQGHLNIWLEFIKWLFFIGDHTLIALLTVAFGKYTKMKYGSEQHVKLMQESKDLFQEFKVRTVGLIRVLYCYRIMFITCYFSCVSPGYSRGGWCVLISDAPNRSSNAPRTVD